MVLALVVSVAFAAARPDVAAPLTVGMVNALGPKVANADAERIGAYLKKGVPRGVAPVIFKSYEELAIALVDDKVDFAWMPPLQGYNARLGGATVVAKLVRNGSPYYRAVLFVRADSKYADLPSLRGARVAWVDRNSSSGYYFPLATLSKAGLSADRVFTDQAFLGSHEAVCAAVVDKKADVGATFADEPPLGQDPRRVEVTGCKQVLGTKGAPLRAVGVSEPIPNDMLVVRKGLDEATRAALREELLAMPQRKDGQGLLRDVFHAEGVATVNDLDFEPVQHALQSANTVEVLK
jgi:phosphonate transport system substrate-binding protein